MARCGWLTVTAVTAVLLCGAGAGVAVAAPIDPPAPPPLAPLGPPGPIPALPLPGVTPPDRDPFYRAPGPLDDHEPGAVLRSRPIAALSPTALTGIRTYQLLYRTTDASGDPIATVATVLLPNVPAPGPRRLVSYHPAEDSLTTSCSPSYTLRTNSGFLEPVESTIIALLLGRGWDVVVPDYEGPRSEFIVGPLEGRAALDGIRAAERFAPAGLDGPHTAVTMMGYSGGSVPTVWGNALAGTYAPELNLVGIAAGGIVANLRENLRSWDGTKMNATIITTGIGLNRAYPQLELGSLLNDRGRALATRDSRDADGCTLDSFAYPGSHVADLTRYRDADALIAVPRVTDVLDKVDLVHGPPFHAPAYLLQQIHDTGAIIKPVDELVRANCAAGATIEYQRGAIGGHVVGFAAYQLPAIKYFADRFAGRPAPTTCPIS